MEVSVLTTAKGVRVPSADGGYAKGEETKQTILKAALAAFGEAGYAAVSTRQLAQTAGVNLPAIKYYFGGKEGLYLSCARHIVDKYRAFTAQAALAARAQLAAGMDRPTAVNVLKGLFDRLIDLQAMPAESEGWTGFVMRESIEPGPAFEILYVEVWRPGVETVAALIDAARGGEGDLERARLDALLLLSSTLAFQSGRSVSMRILAWRSLSDGNLRALREGLHRQIDALAS